jgi:hypothetical protein
MLILVSEVEDIMKRNALIVSLPILLSVLPAAAEEQGSAASTAQPVGVALWNPVQTSSERQAIHGFRLNLPYGANREVKGVDFGVASYTQRDLYGAQFGLGGVVGGDFRGLQWNPVLSITHGTMLGIQEGIYSSSGQLYGMQAGIVTRVGERAEGLRIGAVNLSSGYSAGATFGIVNHGRKVRGLQFGLVNVADELHGVQIGAVNLAKNGFLPFFPVLNSAM